MWRPHPWLATTDREARSPPAPDEGAAFNGWTGLDERQRQCCSDNVRCKPPVQAKKSRRPCEKSPQVERREVRVPVTRRAAPQGAKEDLAPFGAPLPRAREKEKEGAAPRHTTKGADETRLKEETGSCAGARAV